MGKHFNNFMEKSTHVKLLIIQEWLGSFYGENVPEFEINNETIDYLYELRSINQMNNMNSKMALEDSSKHLDYLKYKSLSL